MPSERRPGSAPAGRPDPAPAGRSPELSPGIPPPPPPGAGSPPGVPPPPFPTDAGPTSAASTQAGPDLEPPELTGRFATPRRLHPASIVLGIPLSQLIQALIFPAFAGFAAGGLVTLWILAILGVFSLVFRVLDWQRRYFSFDGAVLRVDSGVLSRSHRSLDVARIQQVEIQRGPIQRLLGLASIRVETAGSASEPEVDLRVLPEPEAFELRAAVRVSKAQLAGQELDASGRPVNGDTDGRLVVQVPMKHVALASITGARLLVLPAVIGAAFQFIGQQMNAFIEWIAQQYERLGGVAAVDDLLVAPDWRLIVVLAIAVIILAMVLAIGVGLVRDGRFRIERIDDDLHVFRGLVTTRESVVPLKRVQLVEIQRNWLRRLLGYASVRIRSAGGSTGGEGRVTVPLIPGADIDRLLREVLPGVPGVPELTSHPRQALRRAMFRWLRPAAYVIGALWLAPMVTGFLGNTVVTRLAYASLALIPLNALLAYVEYRHLAHAATELVVVSRRGALSISTTLAPVVKVQAVTSRANLFQRRLGLTSVVAHVAGPGAVLEIMDAGRDDASLLHTALTEHAARPTPAAAAAVGLGGSQPQPA